METQLRCQKFLSSGYVSFFVVFDIFDITSGQFVPSFKPSSERILRPRSELLHLNQQTASCHFCKCADLWRLLSSCTANIYPASTIYYFENFALLKYHPTFISYIVYVFVFFFHLKLISSLIIISISIISCISALLLKLLPD